MDHAELPLLTPADEDRLARVRAKYEYRIGRSHRRNTLETDDGYELALLVHRLVVELEGHREVNDPNPSED